MIAGIADGCQQAGLRAWSAARPRSCRASTPTASTIWPGFCVGVVERSRLIDGARHRARRSCCWAWPRRASTRTVTRWCGRCCWRSWRCGSTRAGEAGRAARRGAAAPDPHLRARAARAGRRRPAARGGPHHRRRPGRQPAAHAAGRRASSSCRSTSAAGRCRRSSSCSRAAAVSPPTRCCAPSTWASACWSCVPRAARRRSAARCWSRGRDRVRRSARSPPPTAPTRRSSSSAMNVGVLASGSGTNLQALIDARGARRARARAAGRGRRQRPRLPRAERARRRRKCRRSCSTTAQFAVARGVRSRAGRGAASAPRRAGGAGRLHAPARPPPSSARSRSRVHQHPSGAAARVPRRPRAAPGAATTASSVSGCTVHFVDERHRQRAHHRAGGGAGAATTTTKRRWRARILVEEHRLLPYVVRAMAEGRVTADGRRVRVNRELAVGRIAAQHVTGRLERARSQEPGQRLRRANGYELLRRHRLRGRAGRAGVGSAARAARVARAAARPRQPIDRASTPAASCCRARRRCCLRWSRSRSRAC